MKIIKRNDTEVINGSCGKIQEMFDSDKLSIAYVDVTKDFVPHMHKEMEEIYYILEGSGILIVGDERFVIEKDDIVPIPKGKFHSIELTTPEPLRLLAITTPKYNSNDVIEKNI